MATLIVAPGVELHYWDDDFTDPWRKAPAILLQHGFSRSGRFWYNWVPLLSREFRVIRPDLRGMGESAIAEEAYEASLDIFMADLNAILDSSGIDRVVYVGESFGGFLGLSYALSFPDRVTALCLCNTPCRLPRRGRTDPEGDWDTAMRQSIGKLVYGDDRQPAGHPVRPGGNEGLVHFRNGPHVAQHWAQAAGLPGYPGLPASPEGSEHADVAPDRRGVPDVHPGAAAVHG